jgi:hypothetical protein
MLPSLQTGVSPESSVAVAETVMFTIALFGGQIVEGFTLIDEITGGV